MKLSKAVTYPIFVLSLMALIFLAVFLIVNALGAQVNPSQPDQKMKPGIKTAVVWLEGSDWMGSVKGPFKIFEINRGAETQAMKPLREIEGLKGSKEIFLIVQSDLGKEKCLSLLEALSDLRPSRVFIASSFDSTLGNLKKIEPRFWYAASPRSWVKWSLLTSLGIEKIYSPKADFLFIDNKIKELISGRLEKEIQRRNLVQFRTTEQDTKLLY